MAYTGAFPPVTEEEIKAYLIGSTNDPVEKGPPPVMCPYCGAVVERSPFLDTLVQDDTHEFYITSEDSGDAFAIDMQRWWCVKDKSHVFYHSTEKFEE
jgi:hypothetical protein